MSKLRNFKILLVIAGFSLTGVSLTGCAKNIKEEKKVIEETKENNGSIETIETIGVYNAYLKSIGSNTRITYSDIIKIVNIVNKKMYAIRCINGDYIQVGSDYVIAYDKNNELVLLPPLDFSSIDVLTKTQIKREDIQQDSINVSFEEYIHENDIPVVGYKLQNPVTSVDSENELIRQMYGEDVALCVKENGFPLAMYDAPDIYSVKKQNFQKKYIKD